MIFSWILSLWFISEKNTNEILMSICIYPRENYLEIFICPNDYMIDGEYHELQSFA